ncbi:hypothetical protein SeMB42_g02709 [Synchytrium endobioticum]|uniref:PCI domain-containing protein n=1 Tax=Synchytrium endobioticum TaxID=286115 RepID=A0A507DC57_9FUNG|nr:hypothetical protein SeLEV6574_g05597 [Synchytrium endobioticum]TPX49173.1 hypothetical protein SeMB42_g02709 [Synchytrium endobioticum]
MALRITSKKPLNSNNKTTFQLSTYCDSLLEAITNEDGPRLGSCFSLSDDHAQAIKLEIPRVVNKISFLTQAGIEEPWLALVMNHFRVVAALPSSPSGPAHAIELAEDQLTLANALHAIFPSNGIQKWALPALYAVDLDLVRLSAKADLELERRGEKANKSEETVSALRSAFSVCLSDRALIQASRKWGTYYIACLMIRVFFRLKSLHLCSNTLRSIQSNDLPPLDSFPLAHRVTFKYYVGVLAFYNEQYKKAAEELEFSLRHCRARGDKKARWINNRRLILNYYIPARMLQGYLPSQTLFSKYPATADLFSPFVTAIQRGDVRMFDDALQEKESILIDNGTFYAMERLRMVCLRVLFKKVWTLKGQGTRLPFIAFKDALRFVGEDSSLEEVECLLANMIDKGFIKGYLSHELSTIVLSKDKAFPPLTQTA